MTKLEELNEEIEQCKEAIEEIHSVLEKDKALKRLETENDDWKLLMEAYLTDEKDRIANVLTSTTPLREESENMLHQKLMSIRHFRLFMSGILTEAIHAEDRLKEFNERLDFLEGEKKMLEEVK
jgi:chromosome segregation ATPase